MNCSSRTSGVWRRNLAVWVLLSLVTTAFFTGSLYAAKDARDLKVPVGHTELLDFPSPINRISIANPEIADHHRSRLPVRLDYLEGLLADGRPFLAGEEVTWKTVFEMKPFPRFLSPEQTTYSP